MVKINIKSKNNKTKKSNKVIKTIDTVIPVSTPVGSVHFDEFLKICKEPKLILNTIETASKTKIINQTISKKIKKDKKNKKTEKSKKIRISKEKEVVKPDNILLTPQPTLFPLIKALLLPSEDDAFDENTLFSEFVVGKPEKIILKQSSIRELTMIEQQANDTVDEINKLEEKIKKLMEKPKLSESEIIELEKQQLLVMKLLNDFENNLAKIRDIFKNDNLDNTNKIDVNGELIKCHIVDKTEPHNM
ncbi:PREDICTED: uncharacterized protein LOC107172375, partial [Diuraphis noxia]|uniref:uncharacterized protein LOC107172375 n=1 Tax=Diuraphis noxia TaxID=143948 RepID=UPI000763A633